MALQYKGVSVGVDLAAFYYKKNMCNYYSIVDAHQAAIIHYFPKMNLRNSTMLYNSQQVDP